MWWLAVANALAQAPVVEPEGCTRTSVARLARTTPPAVLVLGERKGMPTDLMRARQLVRALAARGPVTVALQAVRRTDQPVLDRLVAGEITVPQLRQALEWERSWGFPFEPYSRLFALAAEGVRFVGIGAPYTAPGHAEDVPVPPGYFEILAHPMGESRVPPRLEVAYTKFVSFADRGFATSALGGWSGEGALVILVDRFHIEGGLGVPWQVAQQTEVPVKGVLLVDAETRCYPGDQVLSFLGL